MWKIDLTVQRAKSACDKHSLKKVHKKLEQQSQKVKFRLDNAIRKKAHQSPK
jgi:hypothetical protein